MVYQVENSDDYFLNNIDALERDKSEPIDAPDFEDILIYKCSVRPEQGENAKQYTGYWIENQNGEVAGYFIFKDHYVFNENGEVKIYGQAVLYRWLHKVLRGKGISPFIFKIHAPNSPLISDPYYGMSDKAYKSWMNMRGFKKRFFNACTFQSAELTQLTNEQKFSASPEAKQWLLVLESENKLQE